MVISPSVRQQTSSGAALHIVVAVVAVLMLLSSTMVALSTMNLNMTTAYHNGQIAQNEAEAAVSRLLYAVSEKDSFGLYGNEEIRGVVTPGYDESQAYHILTFRKDRGFPYSVNNYDRSKPSGYLGRVVPPKMIHAFATGYCRGQYRTIEALIERPDFPYALATSGTIESPYPIVARGTASTASYMAGEQSRPGHIIANSSSQDLTRPAIFIGKDDTNTTNQTFISGFAQSAGLIKILQPATVRCGVRPSGDPVRLPDIPVSSFRNAGEKGVVEISPNALEGQTLDIMYHCPHELTYTGGIKLENAFLYVDGDLTINGSVTGVGAIVSGGTITITGDTNLSAGTRVALVANGNVNLTGTGNYFQGLLYGRGDLTAKNITVLGNAIINAPTTGGGTAKLDHVNFVADPGAATVAFTASSSSDAVSQQKGGDLPFAIGGIGLPPLGSDKPPDPAYYTIGDQGGGGMEGWYEVDNPEPILFWWTRTPELAERALTNLKFENLDALRAMFPDAANVFGALDKVKASTEKYQANQAAITAEQATIAANDQRIAELEADGKPGADALQMENARLQADITARLKENAELQKMFIAEMRTLAEAYVDYYKKHAGKDGRYKKDGKNINVSKAFNFDLSRFLPVCDQVKLTYWHVFHGRM